MPAANAIERPTEALTVAKRYLRRERFLNALVVALVVSLYVGTFLLTSLLPAIVVGAVSLVIARAPILRSRGTVRLRTDDGPETVLEKFSGPTPPVLAFQWGVADEVITRERTAVYRTSYLFGLRSADVTVRTETETAPDGTYRVESELVVNDQPWATYTSTISDETDHTIVDVEYTSNRRFGLRRVPQQFLAERYREDALAVQGYTVVDRDAYFGL
ncbi:hypothetical protein [Haloterrigena salinisoli]|uniref:hypothetical protein n=1 Tax=Haloterrigena salinisoli TaxID=3132747 RepID=UPI0030CD6F6D